MVEHSPKILAREEKATTIITATETHFLVGLECIFHSMPHARVPWTQKLWSPLLL